ncbi:MAG: hypothetical protein EBR79_02010 [Proteobacteria bacterium]|nr:hypothetical protein [Pseudomonadota bacterium]NBX85674.1 hypothetical protein [Pseudomonadota bacterium]
MLLKNDAFNPNQNKLENWQRQFVAAVEGYDLVALERLCASICATVSNLSKPLFANGGTALHALLVKSPKQQGWPKNALPMAKLLVRNGADLYVKDADGRDVVMHLIIRGQIDEAHQLMDEEEKLKDMLRRVA